MTLVGPGSTLETVLLGPCIDGTLRLWRGDGTAELRSVEDPEVVRASLGVGRLARTSPEPSRFREVAMLDADTGTLVLLERPHASGAPASSVEVGGIQMATQRRSAPPSSPGAWRAAADAIRDAVVAAVGRGEFVVVEPGGWAPGAEPYALAIVVPGDDGTPMSHVEAVPTPTGDLWPEVARGPLRAPATQSSLAVVGLLLGQAIAGWAPSPFDIVLTFGSNPAGPITIAAEDLRPTEIRP